MLGRPPSVNMISAVLLLYIFSAIILILSRMMSGSGKYGGVSHVGYLAGFYFFYHFSGKLPENFWAVFAAGVTILGLEGYHLWIYCSEEIERARDVLAFLDGKPRGRNADENSPDRRIDHSPRIPTCRGRGYFARTSTLARELSSFSRSSLLIPFSCALLAISLEIRNSFSIRFSKFAILMA